MANLLLKLVTQLRNFLRFPLHDQFDHFLQENALELLQAAGFERAALNNNVTAAGEQSIVLCLVAEHGVELLIKLDFDTMGELLGQTLAKFFNCRAGILPAILDRRPGRSPYNFSIRWNKVDAVGIDFDDLRAVFL